MKILTVETNNVACTL